MDDTVIVCQPRKLSTFGPVQMNDSPPASPRLSPVVGRRTSSSPYTKTSPALSLKSAKAKTYGRRLKFTHTNTITGGLCSCSQAEVFPQRYDIASDSGLELYGLHQRRRRTLGGWLCDFLPGWMPGCPLDRTVEVREQEDASSSPRKDSADTASEDEVLLFDLYPINCESAPCLEGLWSRELVRVSKNQELVGSILKRNILRHCCAPLCAPCLSKDVLLRVQPHDPTPAEQGFYITTNGSCCKAAGCWCLSPSACDDGDNAPFDLDISVYNAVTHNEDAKIMISGIWKRACAGTGYYLEDEYNVEVELPNTRPYTKREAELLLALAVYIDNRWILPRLKHPCGPVTLPKFCINVCG
eukprot:m.7107 g.7107  ORF g.7107 m.7107 type:complete len:356 (-) comp5078_c0_seq2:158-1225(-)